MSKIFELFGNGSLGPRNPITPSVNATFYAGPISSHEVQGGFIDIVKIGATPPKKHHWRALFKKKPVAPLVVAE